MNNILYDDRIKLNRHNIKRFGPIVTKNGFDALEQIHQTIYDGKPQWEKDLIQEEIKSLATGGPLVEIKEPVEPVVVPVKPSVDESKKKRKKRTKAELDPHRPVLSDEYLRSLGFPTTLAEMSDKEDDEYHRATTEAFADLEKKYPVELFPLPTGIEIEEETMEA
jgi:hypothetical protein